MTGMALAGVIVFFLAIIEVFATLAKDKPFLSFGGICIALVALLKVLTYCI